ncbi:MAG: hypothetical protein ACAH12_09025 [Methylophilaceae bacterium]|uniref:hypothetical protein n=1 Tax=Methylovorus sp. MM2 TaxID=1848038 RepID=UPI0007DF555A|nr:hypothetical protein [Methylovorus sp. MM2]OAM52588.1 hypothetical protein A7981_03765 [Methylovorus sp. MM2]
MATISIKKLDDVTFEVVISAAKPSTHVVTVKADYATKLVGGKLATEELLRHSFEFLLARESNTSILRSFDLSVIARYFPEYEQVIGKAAQ